MIRPRVCGCAVAKSKPKPEATADTHLWDFQIQVFVKNDGCWLSFRERKTEDGRWKGSRTVLKYL